MFVWTSDCQKIALLSEGSGGRLIVSTNALHSVRTAWQVESARTQAYPGILARHNPRKGLG
jgi:hypothetical protein